MKTRPLVYAIIQVTLSLSLSADAKLLSYHDQHKEWCEENRAIDKTVRQYCVTPSWCAVHEGDDRLTKIFCDPYHSYADKSLAAVIVTAENLNSGRDLDPLEVLSSKPEPPNFKDRLSKKSYEESQQGITQVTSGELLPADIVTAKLALRAQIDVWTFPTTVVSIALFNSYKGVLTVTANENGIGARTTKRFNLSSGDIDHLLAALNRSRFWQLPSEGGHMGVVDGMVGSVEVSIPDHKHRVSDAIGDVYAVDLSILSHEICDLVRKRWGTIALG